MDTYYRRDMPQTDSGHKTGSAIRELEEKFFQVFDGIKPKTTTEVEERAPPVCKSAKELSKAQKLSLRTSIQAVTSDKVELKQFDPNFFSHGNIWCRYPSCKQRRLRKYMFDRTKLQKEDLYLCPSHRNNVEDYVAKMCAQKGVCISRKYSPQDLQGYTSMIGLLESGYVFLTKPKLPWGRTGSKKTAILQEVCLNMRNYLVIVNALLNPDDENLTSALTTPLSILLRILEILRNDGEVILATLRGLLDLLKQAIEYILFAFGVIYTWVYLSLIGNPGAQLGAGVGGAIGLAGFAGGPAVGVLTAAGGAFFGGLIGNGLYNIFGTRQEDDNYERLRAYQQFAQANIRVQGDVDHQLQAMPPQPNDEECAVYYLTGSAMGDLMLAVLCLYALPM